MALEGGEGSASRPGRSLPPGKTRYTLHRRLGWPQGRSAHVRKISSPPGFDPRTVQLVASPYTDWATGPTFNPGGGTWRKEINVKKVVGFRLASFQLWHNVFQNDINYKVADKSLVNTRAIVGLQSHSWLFHPTDQVKQVACSRQHLAGGHTALHSSALRIYSIYITVCSHGASHQPRRNTVPVSSCSALHCEDSSTKQSNDRHFIC